MTLLRQTSAGVSLGAGHPEYVGVVAGNPNLFDVLQVAQGRYAPDRYRASFYDGPHKFDREMQKEAFAWFDRWLQSRDR